MTSTKTPYLPNILIEVKDLHKKYRLDGRTVEVLKGVDLTVNTGEKVAVIGPSGSGKSTLLHQLGLLERPSGGSIRLEGREVTALPERELNRLRLSQVGFVFQFHHLLPEFSALENVLMPALIAGKDRGEAEPRARALLNDVGLGGRLEHKPGELSGGEQQRAALARALMNQPKILLADEPTGNLDREASALLKRLLWEICDRQSMSMIIVTHNLKLAEDTDRMLEMVEGRLVTGGW